MQTGSFDSILRTLVRHQIDFIVVGGVSAVLQGAPILTFDLDIVHRRTPENIARLHHALSDIESVHRSRLNVLGEIEYRQGYEDLLPLSEWINFGNGRIQVLKLAAYVALKRGIEPGERYSRRGHATPQSGRTAP
jgi:hypothetical protein